MSPFIPGEFLQKVKDVSPLVHCITNYVTCRDCANLLLACGASPIMADEPAEVEDIAQMCNGLLINIGTLHQKSVESMIQAGRQANRLGRPITFDPVGAGASTLRKQSSQKILADLELSVIRGNVSEILTLARGTGSSHGVDANAADCVSEQSLNRHVEMAIQFASTTKAIVAISGEIDIITDGESVGLVRNGCQIMPRITGTGCMLSALVEAYVAAVSSDDWFRAVVAAHCAMGLAGERSRDFMHTAKTGTGSFSQYLIDSIYNMTSEDLNQGAKYEIR